MLSILTVAMVLRFPISDWTKQERLPQQCRLVEGGVRFEEGKWRKRFPYNIKEFPVKTIRIKVLNTFRVCVCVCDIFGL